MRHFVIICILFLAAGAGFAQNEPEEIETLEIIEIVEDVQAVESVILGLPKYQWLRVSGPIIWCLMVLTIATRYIKKIKGRARQLLKLHKVFAYSAFCGATIHGFLGLFF
ncbi:MAG: hypothetical protein JEZ12_23050 [Desulfobacterium sp.]|nr:hypothetical protein [Desulfobacterium sp.]